MYVPVKYLSSYFALYRNIAAKTGLEVIGPNTSFLLQFDNADEKSEWQADFQMSIETVLNANETFAGIYSALMFCPSTMPNICMQAICSIVTASTCLRTVKCTRARGARVKCMAADGWSGLTACTTEISSTACVLATVH